jgi:uncharacterized NAD-dependent epimerase/dehydratase family protein
MKINIDNTISENKSLKIAVLGTDSATGKSTTAQLLAKGFKDAGYKALTVGERQTVRLESAKYSTILDSVINDLAFGEIENAVNEAWINERPDVIVIEGQGSLLNPAYPGGFEILLAGKPDIVVIQHAPARKEYSGFPGYPLHPLAEQIKAIELLSGKKIVAVSINHEDLTDEELSSVIDKIELETFLPVADVIVEGPERLVNALIHFIINKDKRHSYEDD